MLSEKNQIFCLLAVSLALALSLVFSLAIHLHRQPRQDRGRPESIQKEKDYPKNMTVLYGSDKVIFFPGCPPCNVTEARSICREILPGVNGRLIEFPPLNKWKKDIVFSVARDLGASQVWLGLYSPAGQQEFVWASSGLPEIGYMRVRTERFRKDEDLYTSVRVDQNSTFNMVQFRAGGAELSVVCEYDVPR